VDKTYWQVNELPERKKKGAKSRAQIDTLIAILGAISAPPDA
jgi:hypothetical protein